ncbi:unnamed protein product [Mytilus coruscus]|uniref:Uncharacterized protein n=1 Tax=Mytilus coruscus TaxID=42192 RepID=A0A6J8B0M3_MYTCO|nr:unnamed protein product [Mytilus coruscus]
MADSNNINNSENSEQNEQNDSVNKHSDPLELTGSSQITHNNTDNQSQPPVMQQDAPLQPMPPPLFLQPINDVASTKSTNARLSSSSTSALNNISNSVSDADIDNCVERFSEAVVAIAEPFCKVTTSHKSEHRNAKLNFDKPWFSDELKILRRNYIRALNSNSSTNKYKTLNECKKTNKLKGTLSEASIHETRR